MRVKSKAEPLLGTGQNGRDLICMEVLVFRERKQMNHGDSLGVVPSLTLYVSMPVHITIGRAIDLLVGHRDVAMNNPNSSTTNSVSSACPRTCFCENLFCLQVFLLMPVHV